MNIEEILSRLERIDHKEYSCGFEFADSSTFDEMSRCFEERKILAKEIERLNDIINEFDDFITNVDSHINLGDESEEFILVRDKWLELQELKGSDKE